MRIGLNLLHAHRGIGGGWQYIAEIVATLQKQDNNNEYIAYCTSDSRSMLTDQTRFQVKQLRINAKNRLVRIFCENTALQILAKRDGIDVMHWFANVNALLPAARSVVTVYDLLCFSNPSTHALSNRLYLRTMIPLSAKTATVLAPMSESTAQDLRKWLKVPSDKMVVISAPINDRFRELPSAQADSFRLRNHLPDRFWLYVAHCYPHKNHSGLLQAYALLKQQNPTAWPLVLRGKRFNRGEELDAISSRLGIQSSIHWLPPLQDHEMPLLYSSAASLVFPSTFEGGGIPIMEAMACGCPVLASDIPTTREFAQNAAVIFDPANPAAIASAMLQFERNAELRAECRHNGFETVESFRPAVIFGKLQAAYEKAFSPRTRCTK
jgi:glycosyltransferase involved in cell wall biosynthesis